VYSKDRTKEKLLFTSWQTLLDYLRMLSWRLMERGLGAGLPGWPFWGQISEIWSQITLAGTKIFVWRFGSFPG